MSMITVEYTDGTMEVFFDPFCFLYEETSRPGGSYCTSIRYTNGFAIIKDAWGKETVIPSEHIKKIIETPTKVQILKGGQDEK